MAVWSSHTLRWLQTKVPFGLILFCGPTGTQLFGISSSDLPPPLLSLMFHSQHIAGSLKSYMKRCSPKDILQAIWLQG